MKEPRFTEIEESVSFYTRNDFAIMNYLLVGDMEKLWGFAPLAYGDNKIILKEYEDGIRTVSTEYDKKWIKSLEHRIIEELDFATKEKILQTAKKDISNILGAMKPTENKLLLYRTAWVSKEGEEPHTYPYAPQYKSLSFEAGDILDIKIISSTSFTPYREEDGIECDFYRYEITVPQNALVLELDSFECHNEEGEVLLPPMKCRVNQIRSGNCINKRCRGIVELEYMEN